MKSVYESSASQKESSNKLWDLPSKLFDTEIDAANKNDVNGIKLVSGWQIDSLLQVNRLFPELQEIVNAGYISLINNYEVFTSYPRRCTLSQLFYCQGAKEVKTQISSNQIPLHVDIPSKNQLIEKHQPTHNTIQEVNKPKSSQKARNQKGSQSENVSSPYYPQSQRSLQPGQINQQQQAMNTSPNKSNNGLRKTSTQQFNKTQNSQFMKTNTSQFSNVSQIGSVPTNYQQILTNQKEILIMQNIQQQQSNLYSSSQLKLESEIDEDIIPLLKNQVPKIMRMIPKFHQGYPIQGVHQSNHFKKVVQDQEFKNCSLSMLIRYFECFEDDDQIYIVSEQYETDLCNFLKKKTSFSNIKEHQVLELGLQILTGFLYINQNIKIIASLKLSSILVEVQNRSPFYYYYQNTIDRKQESQAQFSNTFVKLPLFSYSTFNLPLSSMPFDSVKYLSPEIISSNYTMELTSRQSTWAFGVLLLDIINITHQSFSPFDLKSNEISLSAKQQKSLVIKRILSFKVEDYLKERNDIFQQYSHSFKSLLKEIFSQDISVRPPLEIVAKHDLFIDFLSINKFYEQSKQSVSLKPEFMKGRIPFSIQELEFK